MAGPGRGDPESPTKFVAVTGVTRGLGRALAEGSAAATRSSAAAGRARPDRRALRHRSRRRTPSTSST